MSDDPKKSQTVDQELHNTLVEHFQLDWRKDLTVTMRADDLYWLVHLARVGIEARKEQAKKEQGISMTASLGSWYYTLEKFATKIGEAAQGLSKKAKK